MKPANTSSQANAIVRAISREDMAALPIHRYEGEVSLVATLPDLQRAMADLEQEQVVGLDTETRPAFRKGEVHLPCLVQVASARRVYLFQLRAQPVLAPVAGLLQDVRVIKAGIALAHDLRALKQLVPFEERNVLDLGMEARRWGLEQTGLRNLAGIFLGVRIPKGARTSNWAAPQLTAAQITYAATDAWICRELFLRFRTLGMLRAKTQARSGSAGEPPQRPA